MYCVYIYIEVNCVTEQGKYYEPPPPQKLAKTGDRSPPGGSPLKSDELPAREPSGESAEALPAALGDLLGGVDGVRDQSTLDALPAVLDRNVPAAYQLKDVLRQIYKRLQKKKQKRVRIMK